MQSSLQLQHRASSSPRYHGRRVVQGKISSRAACHAKMQSVTEKMAELKAKGK